MTDASNVTAVNDATVSTANGSAETAPNANDVSIVDPPDDSDAAQWKAKGRATWGGKTEFLLSAVGFAVGLGNVWRFPYLCYSNGGGAFLIPYTLMLAFVGLPLFFLELAFGQYASLGPITIWGRVCPLFKGIGYTMVAISLLVSTYYNVIIAYTLFYFFASFTAELPWSSCGHHWNTAACAVNKYSNVELPVGSVTTVSPNVTVWPDFNSTTDVTSVTTDNMTSARWPGQPKSPAEEYWEYYVLGVDTDTSVYNIGAPRWHLTLCLLLAWVVVYLCIIRGIKTSGKVVYFTATFPYVLLFILFIRGVSLPGAGKGIRYYLLPDFNKMGRVEVWKDAAVQILYSLAPGFGSLLTMGSFNKFHNNCYTDSILITCINCGTSVFAGFVIFSVLGYMAEQVGTSVDEVVKSGPGLAFTVYPEALAHMPGSQFWSVMFFFMLFTLGLDSQFAGLECIVTGFVDEFPKLRMWKPWVTLAMCIVMFFFGIPCVTQGGMYVIHLMDKFATSWTLLFTTSLEAIIIAWIYGYRRFCDDIETMIGFRPNKYWITCWCCITPVIITIIFVFSCVEYNGLVYEETGYRYPKAAEGIGWVIVVATLILIPVWMVVKLAQCVQTWENFLWVLRGPAAIKTLHLKSLIEPTSDWGPALPEHREERQRYEDGLHRHSQDVAASVGDVSDTANIVENENQNFASNSSRAASYTHGANESYI